MSFMFLADDGTEMTTVLESGDAVEFDTVLGTFRVETLVQITIDGVSFTLVPGSAVSLGVVDVVIKPGSANARINRCGKGVTTIALLGSACLDVSDLDNLAFGDADDLVTIDVPPMRVKLNENINGDGYPDAVLQVKTSALNDAGLLVEGAPLYVTGYLPDGTMVRGFDEVWLAGGPNCK